MGCLLIDEEEEEEEEEESDDEDEEQEEDSEAGEHDEPIPHQPSVATTTLPAQFTTLKLSAFEDDDVADSTAVAEDAPNNRAFRAFRDDAVPAASESHGTNTIQEKVRKDMQRKHKQHRHRPNRAKSKGKGDIKSKERIKPGDW